MNALQRASKISEGDLDHLFSQGVKKISSVDRTISVVLIRKFWVYTAPGQQESPSYFNLSGKVSSVDDNSPLNYTPLSQSKRSAYCSGRTVTLQIPNYVRLFSMLVRDSVMR